MRKTNLPKNYILGLSLVLSLLIRVSCSSENTCWALEAILVDELEQSVCVNKLGSYKFRLGSTFLTLGHYSNYFLTSLFEIFEKQYGRKLQFEHILLDMSPSNGHPLELFFKIGSKVNIYPFP